MVCERSAQCLTSLRLKRASSFADASGYKDRTTASPEPTSMGSVSLLLADASGYEELAGDRRPVLFISRNALASGFCSSMNEKKPGPNGLSLGTFCLSFLDGSRAIQHEFELGVATPQDQPAGRAILPNSIATQFRQGQGVLM